MKKLLSVSLILMLLSVVNLQSQTPQYYNHANTSGTSNSFPFNQTSGKAVNNLILPGEINQPGPVPPGMRITKVYFFHSAAGTRTYTNLHILLAQDTITTLTTATFYPGPYDTVFNAASTSLTHTLNGWTQITLDRPFNYDPTKSLIVFVGQCGSSGSGGSVRNQNYSAIRRVWSVGGCPFVPYAGGDAAVFGFGVDVEPIPQYTPDILYYKFENNPSSSLVLNCASPGSGTNPAPIANVTLTSGGQFDSCITGTGLGSAGVATGWNWNLGTSSWTISFWVQIPSTNSGSAYYLFGDAGSGSFRCFHNGVAGPDSLVLRGTGILDVRVNGIGPSPTHVAFVYDSATSTIHAYKNGVLNRSVVQTPLNMATGTGFRVGGYSSSISFIGKLDEFRVYRTALSPAAILASWNQDISCGYLTAITGNLEIPMKFELSQNYPNPFNPVTKISYALPKAGLVSIKIYDILGREVLDLVNEVRAAGYHTIDFDGSELSSGTYFYRLESNGFTDTKKMVLIK